MTSNFHQFLPKKGEAHTVNNLKELIVIKWQINHTIAQVVSKKTQVYQRGAGGQSRLSKVQEKQVVSIYQGRHPHPNKQGTLNNISMSCLY